MARKKIRRRAGSHPLANLAGGNHPSRKAGQKGNDQHSFKKVEPEDNFAKVEQMAQDMRQSKRQELREAIRTKSRAVKISSHAQNTTPREI